MVPGARAVVELVRAAPRRVHRILVAHERPAPVVEEVAREAGIPVSRVDAEALGDHAPVELAQGVLALAEPPPVLDLEGLLERALALAPPRILLALDEVQDPRNLGALVRSAEFFGIAGALWGRDRAAGLGPAAVRASAGASERLPTARVANLARSLRQCRDAGFWVVGTVVSGGRSLAELAADPGLPENLVVVLGGEHGGLRRLTREQCDFLVTIAARGHVGSLNVSAAGAVVLGTLVAARPTRSAGD